jgi:WD40 repeat protein
MGIWPAYSDGTDINAVDVSRDHRLVRTNSEIKRFNLNFYCCSQSLLLLMLIFQVVTAGDDGLVTLLNYPCVVKNAPSLGYRGHSSHVLCARFASNDTRVVSVGGNDRAVILWKVIRRSSGAEPRQGQTSSNNRR